MKWPYSPRIVVKCTLFLQHKNGPTYLAVAQPGGDIRHRHRQSDALHRDLRRWRPPLLLLPLLLLLPPRPPPAGPPHWTPRRVQQLIQLLVMLGPAVGPDHSVRCRYREPQ